MRRWLPLLVFLALGGMLWAALDPERDPKLLPSALVGKPFPSGVLDRLDGNGGLDFSSLRGKPFVVNLFASWCPECVTENPVLIDFAQRSEVPLIGIAYKDDPAATRQWLQRWGNPFDEVVLDLNGRFGIEVGAYGAPETYFVDAAGIVRKRHVGALSAADLSAEVARLGAPAEVRP